MPKQPEISEKNKKNEILEAYHAVLAQLKEKQSKKPLEVQKSKEETKLIEKNRSLSSEKIVKGIAEIKLLITETLDDIEGKLLGRFRTFQEIEASIKIAENNLNEIHQITAEADSLAALKLAQKKEEEDFRNQIEQERLDFENDIFEKRSAWNQEHKDHEWQWKEELKRKETERKREEEEYQYQIKTKRQKEQDNYETNKLAQEKELNERKSRVEAEWNERERLLREKEEHYQNLLNEAEQFPQKLQEAIESTRKETEERVKSALQFKMQLAEREMEGERTLHQQRVEALEAKINEQHQRIRQLVEQLESAGQQVQTIAVKAIEGASFRSNPGGYYDVISPKSSAGRQEGEK